MEIFIENLAHFSHGMLLCFFLLASFDLRHQRKQTRLLRFLFWEMVFWVFIELKDLLYLYDPWWDDASIYTINLTIDMWTVPAAMLLMFEVLSPGWIRTWRIVCMMALSVLFSLLFILTRDMRVFYLLIAYSILLGTFSLVLIWVASRRYDRFVIRNYSSVENISVAWMRVFITMLYIDLLIWTMISLSDSYLNDVIYYLSTLVLWCFIYYNTRAHRVIDVPPLLGLFSSADEEKSDGWDDAANENWTEKEDKNYSALLEHCMTVEKLYLNPDLTLAEVAASIGSNRTYLSQYINNTLNTTFYEYVNGYRVREATYLLANRPEQPLHEIAEACGFNSISTFRRSFKKEKGVTPSEYRTQNR